MLFVPRVLPCLAIVLAIAFAQDKQSEKTQVLRGHIDPDQVMTFVYAPFEVDPGVSSIYVRDSNRSVPTDAGADFSLSRLQVLQDYSLKGNNSVDLGIFDARGYQVLGSGPLDDGNGFRGWSGGFRNNFTISLTEATPAYIAGAITPGTWNVVLGPYNVLPQGVDWNLTITFGYDSVEDYYQPTYADISRPLSPAQLSRVNEDGEIWLRGDFHIHSVYSDGQYTPQEQVDHALQRDLDFIFFSEHNTYSGNAHAGALDSENLLIGRAIEVTTRHGHWQAIGNEREQIIEWRYDPGDDPGYAAAVHQVHRSGGLVSVNHPFASCGRCNWTFPDWERNDAVEVWNGGTAGDLNQRAVEKWQELLVSGKRTTAIGGSDSHNAPSLNGLPTTVVKASDLSQASILEGVRARRVYIVEGPGMTLDFSIGNAGIGDVVSTATLGNASVTLRSSGFEGQRASFVTDAGYVRNETINAESAISMPLLDVGADANFVRVEVRNSTDGLLGLTNPIYFE